MVGMANAQNSVWEKGNEKGRQAKSKWNKGKVKAKKWKQHLAEYGLSGDLKHQLAIGGKLNSNGWCGAVTYLKRIDPRKLHLYQLSFSEIRHEKQVKQERNRVAYTALGESTPYIFGKVNNLYTLQVGYGKEHLLLPGVVEDNLSVSFRYQGGFSLALLKPYYLRLVHTDRSDPNDIPILHEEHYTNENAEVFLDSRNILGASKWSKGLGELKPVPGAYIEAAFAIEPAKGKFFVQTITIGSNVAFYAKELPVMAEVKATALQTSVFVGLSLGKRWK